MVAFAHAEAAGQGRVATQVLAEDQRHGEVPAFEEIQVFQRQAEGVAPGALVVEELVGVVGGQREDAAGAVRDEGGEAGRLVVVEHLVVADLAGQRGVVGQRRGAERVDEGHLGLQGSAAYRVRGQPGVHQHRLAIAVADLATDVGLAEHGGETGAVQVDVVEIADLVVAGVPVGEEVQGRRLVVEAQVVEAELGVVQGLDHIGQGQAVLAAVAGLVVLQPAGLAERVGEAAFVHLVGDREEAADAVDLGLFPFVLVVGLQAEVLGQVYLAEHLAHRQEDLLDLDPRGVGLGAVGRAHGRGDAIGDEQAFAPAHHLVADAQVEVVPAQVPGAVDIVVEQAQVLAVLVDGVVGEVVGLRALAAGEAVGGACAVVVAAVVDVVVEAAGAHEQAVVLLPVEVGLGEETGAVGDQAALVEGVVAVVDVGDGRVRKAPGQRMVAGLGTPGQGVGEGGIPGNGQVVAGLEAQRGQRPAEGQQGCRQGQPGGDWRSCCCHFGLRSGRLRWPLGLYWAVHYRNALGGSPSSDGTRELALRVLAFAGEIGERPGIRASGEERICARWIGIGRFAHWDRKFQ
ncbi:hypothetical protein D3C78_646380 [compost metagenome]